MGPRTLRDEIHAREETLLQWLTCGTDVPRSGRGRLKPKVRPSQSTCESKSHEKRSGRTSKAY